MRAAWTVVAIMAAAFASGCAGQAQRGTAQSSPPSGPEAFQRDGVVREAEAFFGRGARGLADVLNRVLGEHGPPDGYIRGEEGGGALGVGFRYGHGMLYMKDGTSIPVYWRGPSLGLDIGGSAAKAFILIYDLPDVDTLFRRYGGVEGSLYYVGGVGMTYNRNGETVLAPVRMGVGWRQGVSVGYLHLSRERSWLPF
jgi:hypothetical protein